MLLRGMATVLLVLTAHCAMAAQPWAEKMFDATSRDFGAVARGSKVEHHFTITNLYKEDAHIASVRSSCGCTKPEIAKRTLKSHETADLVAKFNTRAFLGQHGATLTVTFDRPFYAEVQLHVSGYIRSDVVLSPAGAEFGSVDEGSRAARTISIRYAGRADWAITGVQSTNPFLTVETKETARGVGQVAYDMIVQLKEDAPVGYLKDQIWVLTNDRRASRFPIDVEGRVTSEITITPASLFLGIVEPGQAVTKNLVIRGKRPFRIVEIQCGDHCFQFKAADKVLPVHAVRVTFTAGEKPGKLACKIRIKTDLASHAAPELVAYAQITPPRDSAEAP